MEAVEKVLEVSRKLLAAGPASAPVKEDDSTRGGLYSTEVSIDSDLVVILAALLCGLICALGLNSLLRCALRCGRRLVSDDHVANTGLKKAAIKALPSKLAGDGGGCCPICLTEFVEGETLRLLPTCNHAFHVDCIDTWLASHCSCPTCRHCLKKKPSPAPVISTAPQPISSGAPPPLVTCSVPPAPVACCASPVPASDVVHVIVEAPGSEQSSLAVEPRCHLP